jgi:hypothetical protein
MLFFFLQFLFADIGHVDFDFSDEAGLGLEGVEENHEVFGGDVHPVVVAQGQSPGGLDVLAFDYILLFILPDLLLVVFKIFEVDLFQFGRLFVVVFHPLSDALVFFNFLGLLFLHVVLHFEFFFHVVVVFEFIVDVLVVDCSSVAIDVGGAVEGGVLEHLAEPLIDLRLG